MVTGVTKFYIKGIPRQSFGTGKSDGRGPPRKRKPFLEAQAKMHIQSIAGIQPGLYESTCSGRCKLSRRLVSPSC